MNMLFKCALTTVFVLNSSLAPAQDAPPPPPPSSVTLPPGNVAQTPRPSNPAEGYYGGTLSNGNNALLIVTDNGGFWLIASPAGATTPLSIDFIFGAATIGNGTLDSSNAVLLTPVSPPVPYAVSATFSPKIAMEGTYAAIPSSTPPAKFSLTYSNLYEVAYPITTVAGRYRGVMRAQNAAEEVTVDVSADGTVSATLATCSFSGNVQQFPSKNPYAVALTFSGPRCEFGNDQAIGVMTVLEVASGAHVLSIFGTNQRSEKFLHMVLSKTATGNTPPAAPAESLLQGARHW